MFRFDFKRFNENTLKALDNSLRFLCIVKGSKLTWDSFVHVLHLQGHSVKSKELRFYSDFF